MFGAHLLRRTASAPTKSQKKIKKGFPEISIDAKDYSSEGASEDRESEDPSQPRFNRESDNATPEPTPTPAQDSANGELHPEDLKGKAASQGGRGNGSSRYRVALSEPLRRANRVRIQDPLDEKQGVYARVAINGSRRVGMASNCIKCVIGSRESPDLEQKFESRLTRRDRSEPPQVELSPPEQRPVSLPRRPEPKPLTRQTLEVHSSHRNGSASARNSRSCSVPRKRATAPSAHGLRWQCPSQPNYGSTVNLMAAAHDGNLLDSDSSSLETLGSPELPARFPKSKRQTVGTLQREMNTLFVQKLEEIRSKSPIFFTGKTCRTPWHPQRSLRATPLPPCLLLRFRMYMVVSGVKF